MRHLSFFMSSARHRKSYYTPYYRGRTRWDARTSQEFRQFVYRLKSTMGDYHLTHNDNILRSKIWHAVNNFMPVNNDWSFRHLSRRQLVKKLYTNLYEYTIDYMTNNFRPSMAAFDVQVTQYLSSWFNAGRGPVSYFDADVDDEF